jgi:paraquat-inducible protein A
MSEWRPQRASYSELLACHECDTLSKIPALKPGRAARCRCCGTVLLRNPKGGLDRPIALYSAALILLLLSNVFPFLTLEIQGRVEATNIFGASLAMYRAGMAELAVAVFLTTILTPALLISSCLYVLLGVRLRRPLPALRSVLSWISQLEPWVMLDVFMLGVLVAFVKLGHMATMHIGISLFAYIGLILTSAAATAAFEPHLLWQRMAYPRVKGHAS